MIHFQSVSEDEFLSHYWQKKPLLLRQALPNFINPLSRDELAGLSMEEELESRFVFKTQSSWQLKKGPFCQRDFKNLPQTPWTLLVNGVEKVHDDVYLLLEKFNFLPQWRIDDVMISYAVKGGSVGPHYDHYDVFLLQASGQRKWSLTSKQCHEQNVLPNTELRIMAHFDVEEEYLLEPGDILYVPPGIGHYGVSQDDECMTYSFGYREYKTQELWDGLGDFWAENQLDNAYFKDPNWSTFSDKNQITVDVWKRAQELILERIQNDRIFQDWFGCFATQLDASSDVWMPAPIDNANLEEFEHQLQQCTHLLRDATCRIATMDHPFRLYINGEIWIHNEDVSIDVIHQFLNHRLIKIEDIQPMLSNQGNILFLFRLWEKQWLQTI